MDYLQYEKEDTGTESFTEVLNLVINGLPSIHKHHHSFGPHLS